MKTLRLVLAAALLVAACDSRSPVAPPAAPGHDAGPADSPEGGACDSICRRSPQVGSGNG